MTFTAIVDLLKSKGYKITDNRLVLLEVLFNNIDQLLTIEELYVLVKDKHSKINRSTVYRNIETLQSLNLLFKKITPSGAATFKVICSDKHHHHMICDNCGTIIVYPHCSYTAYEAFAKENGFLLTGHTLELHGLCKNCQEKTS